jgi:putative transposase
MYLVAVIDWFSRYVLDWALSNTLDGGFCIETLRGALRVEKPEIFNTDQGAQFTARAFTSVLEEAGVQISYSNVLDLDMGLQRYFRFYNHQRVHQSLGYQTPAEVHFEYGKCKSKIHLSFA